MPESGREITVKLTGAQYEALMSAIASKESEFEAGDLRGIVHPGEHAALKNASARINRAWHRRGK